MSHQERALAEFLVQTFPRCTWEGIIFARAYLSMLNGAPSELAARLIYESRARTLRASRQITADFKGGFTQHLEKRKNLGSAENAITKLFPARITEEKFRRRLEQLKRSRKSLDYTDDRENSHGQYTLTDFTLKENTETLPINIKNAGTRFEQSEALVGLQPDDCIPIPAYKAYGAVEKLPNLVYVVAPDYALLQKLNAVLFTLFSRVEAAAWQLLNQCAGRHVRSAEDAFVGHILDSNWSRLVSCSSCEDFYLISAKRAISILRSKPKRTPGLGLRAWGTGASAEVNVHVSIKQEMTPWAAIESRIQKEGLRSILADIERTSRRIVEEPAI